MDNMYDGIKVTIENGTMSDDEIRYYVDEVKKKYPDTKIEGITVRIIDDENVEVSCSYESTPFERIRRITGYLVGGLDHFNNAKREEESMRVKHDGVND